MGDIATKALKKLAMRNGAKLAKKGEAPAIPEGEPFVAGNDEGAYWCGCGVQTIMPADPVGKKTYIAGYRMDHPVTGVLDDLTVSAMWIDCGGKGLLLVSADIIGLTGADLEEAKRGLAGFCSRTGCAGVHVSCTHTHASPDTVGYWGRLFPPQTGKDAEYMKTVFEGIRKAAEQAYDNRKKGRLYFGSVHVPEAIGTSRFDRPSNDLLTRFRFVPDDGGREIWLLNFSAHPNTLGGDNTLISADYPGFMRKKIAESKDADVLFTVGAIASVNIADMGTEDRLERTRLGGEALAKAAVEMSDEQLPADIYALTQSYYAPIDNYVLAFMSIIRIVSSLKAACPESGTGLALKTQMTYLKLGGKKILMLPGEAFYDFVYGGYSGTEESSAHLPPENNPTPLAEIAGDPGLIIFGVTDDMTGYMVPPNESVLHPTQAYLSSARDRFDRNHYHETNGLGENITFTIADVFKKIVERAGE